MKPVTEAVLTFVSADNLILVVSTSGTRAAPSYKLINWKINWGDGNYEEGNNFPPQLIDHKYTKAGVCEVELKVIDSKNTSALDSKSMRVRGPIPIPPTVDVRGPTPTITCPVGAIPINAGSTTASRQAIINAAPSNSTFCIETGSHSANSPNNSKTGNTYVGQYGAVILASGWLGSDPEDAIFRDVGTGIDNVTIKNLVLDGCPFHGVQSYQTEDNWIVDHCEVRNNRYGVVLGPNGQLLNSLIHNNVGIINDPNPALRGGGYGFNGANGVRMVNNEIYNNGQEQKFIYNVFINAGDSYYIADNYVHDNIGDGIWLDGDSHNTIIENNTVIANGRTGISVENCFGVEVRTNTCRNNLSGEAILLTCSRECTIHHNIMTGNLFGIGYFVNCAVLGFGYWNSDLTNNESYNNDTTVPFGVGTYLGAYLLVSGACGANYINNLKNNRYHTNTYRVTGTGAYWLWGGGVIDWASWQAVPQDADGTRIVS